MAQTLQLTSADLASLAFFLLVWAFFTYAAEGVISKRPSLTVAMNRQREIWIRTMARRDLRMIDTSIMLGLQQGTAFFASSALIAVGGCFALLGTPDKLLALLADLPYSAPPTRELFEFKVIGLVLILAYAFFKFSWAYRLFNYCSILIGAVPPAAEFPNDPERAERAVKRAARMNILAAKHFGAGLRGVFFSVAYLGWFIHPLALGATTLLLLGVLMRRQFFSAAREAALEP
ncbi:MAG: DUF599 domain-containing protein [Mesorhizobium amorphae]|nr:MAG: DUF599 domain-containing protein [Mesorhizobium amorphae]